ncbi:ricin-type beta-trefoil lectin domain protein [Dactylosporangium siamense]|uniref:Lipase n=1 Tax=Dactylosporangium siamense TaxID=685454 RepID=A0A919PWR9_9ACTN|nr:ricin-type beta-trefoil lectin domain protein [Dactylosporangium siamense]GIG51871.1 lipase [Dactylosporangium siamense]
MSRLIAALVLGLAATAVTAAPAAQAAESNGGIRVLPLGDSITDGGTANPGAYRTELWRRLTAGGYTVDFVGSRANGPAELGDHDHEGHPGYRIDQIQAGIAGWVQATNPQTVLLHLGTNDIGQNWDLPNAPARLFQLVDTIIQLAPAAEIFVASVAPVAFADREARTQTYNAAIPGLVQQRAAAGKHVHFVEMHAALTTADLTADGVHPTAAGSAKMGATWHAALRTVPTSIGPGTGLEHRASGLCLDVAGRTATAGAHAVIATCDGGPSQRWVAGVAGELRVFGTMCLDVAGAATAHGSDVVIWTCNGQSNQRWTLRANGSLVGAASGRCVKSTYGGTTPGTILRIADCDGTAVQLWSRR